MAEPVNEGGIFLAQVGGMRQLHDENFCGTVLLQLFVFDWIPLRARHNVITVRLDDLRDIGKSTQQLKEAVCAGTGSLAPYELRSLEELVLTPLHVTRRTKSDFDLVPLRFNL